MRYRVLHRADGAQAGVSMSREEQHGSERVTNATNLPTGTLNGYFVGRHGLYLSAPPLLHLHRQVRQRSTTNGFPCEHFQLARWCFG